MDSDTHWANYFLDLLPTLPEGQHQEAHGGGQLALHQDFGSGPADVGAVEELPGRLSVRLDHGLQGAALHRVLHGRHVHAKVRLRRKERNKSIK